MRIRSRDIRSVVAALILFALALISCVPAVFASQATSTNYGVSEVQFGSGGALHVCSTNYCAKQSAGESTVGNTKSTNYQAQTGFNNYRDPFLEVVAPGGTLDFGVLDSTTVKTVSTTFSIKTYLASGYNVYLDGTSPKHNNGHVLTTMSSSGVSVPGTEQFGINLRDNSSPNVGTDVVQVPDSSFSFGTPASGYNTVDNFKYVAGDVIASSSKSSGETDYTMSMIANIATTTIGGRYTGRLVINVVPTF